jgi:hypothetical protein
MAQLPLDAVEDMMIAEAGLLDAVGGRAMPGEMPGHEILDVDGVELHVPLPVPAQVERREEIENDVEDELEDEEDDEEDIAVRYKIS